MCPFEYLIPPFSPFVHFCQFHSHALDRIQNSGTIQAENFERNMSLCYIHLVPHRYRVCVIYTWCHIGTNSGRTEVKQFCYYFRQMDNRETEGQFLSRQENRSAGNFSIVHIAHDAKFSEFNQPYKP